jgi:Zn-finger nucleic acid-binding protein
VENEAPCPKCGVSLDQVVNREVNFLGCTTCFGLWVTETDLGAYVEKASTPQSAASFKTLLGKALTKVVAATANTRRHCPHCNAPLARLGFGEQPFVILDRCGEHGLWLDRTELKKVVRSCRAAAHPHGLPKGVVIEEDDDDDEEEPKPDAS